MDIAERIINKVTYSGKTGKYMEDTVHKILGKKCKKNKHERKESVEEEVTEHITGKERKENYR
jgi:hypothetical protein